jgi:thiosulfate/3-mercaptopyruvate sulfurtransferase
MEEGVMLDPAYREGILVDSQWLAEHLKDPGIRIIHLGWRPRFVDGKGIAEDRKEDYLEGHVPGAVFLGGVSDLTDPSVEGITLVAPPEHFARAMSRAGIGDDTMVIVYDDAPLPLASARLWWTLHYYGHTKAMVLAGGLRQWRKEGLPMTKEIPAVPSATFTPRVQAAIRATKETVSKSLGASGVLIIDCMAFEHHSGTVPRPWGVRDGHIPGAVCLPWLALGLGIEKAGSHEARAQALQSDDPIHYLPAEELRDLFAKVGVTPGKRVITYCGGGYAATHAFLALRLIGFENAAVYDGSIAEWTRDPTLPMEKS